MISNGAAHPQVASVRELASSCDNTPLLPSGHTEWKDLYKAAILETERNAIARRVSDAEKAVIDRAREVFYNPSTAEEQEALEDALYILRALRTASS